MLTFGVALFLASTARTAFPGGSVQIPAGCEGPAEIRMAIDSFIGSIECPKENFYIFILGDAAGSPGCGQAEGDGATMALATGHPIHLRAVTLGASPLICVLGGQSR
jgi:hypothetical protein